MDCEYHYRLTRRAEKELDDILDYIGNKLDNAKAAAKLVEDIGRCMETVCAVSYTHLTLPTNSRV